MMTGQQLRVTVQLRSLLGSASALTLVALVSTCALLLRWMIALHPHGGMSRPPMHGDFEAQRHWMEVTADLPVGEWYRQSPRNDLQYWGLDYSPLTAYLSWMFGVIAKRILPSLVNWESSRGIEGPNERLFMRLSVLLLDLLLFFPAVWLYVSQRAATGRRSRSKSTDNSWSDTVGVAGEAAFLLLSPPLILVDHGHFQYNCVSLGFVLLSVVAIMQRSWMAAALLFTLALNYKQTMLYYAPAYFVTMLLAARLGGIREILSLAPPVVGGGSGPGRRGTTGVSPAAVSWLSIASAIGTLGFAVVAVFAVLWAPFCALANVGVMDCDGARSPHPDAAPCTCLGGLTNVLHRLFPFSRGLFEDKVSNIWCALEPLLRLRGAGASGRSAAVLASTALTLALMIPSLIAMGRAGSLPQAGGNSEPSSDAIATGSNSGATSGVGLNGSTAVATAGSAVDGVTAAAGLRRRRFPPVRRGARSPSAGARRAAVVAAPAVDVAALPVQLRAPWRLYERFLLCAFNTSLSYFLASFQVHEKAILLPLLPLSLLRHRFPLLAAWANVAFTWSMWPLIVRDQLVIPAVVLCVLSAMAGWPQHDDGVADAVELVCSLRSLLPHTRVTVSQLSSLLTRLAVGSLCAMAALSAAAATVSPPKALPDLFSYASAVGMAGALCAVLVTTTGVLLAAE